MNNTIDQLHQTDSTENSNQLTVEYTFSSRVPGTFSKVDHMLGHKININKFKKIEINTEYLLQHKGMKLEINRKKTGKSTAM